MRMNLNNTSIARRLATMYALAAAIVLSVIVVGLYCIEISEINRYQKAEMKNRLALIEHNIIDKSTLVGWKNFQDNLTAITPKGSDIYVRIDSEDQRYRFEAPFKIKTAHINKHKGFSKINIEGRDFRTLSKIIPANGERPAVILSIAVDTYFNETEDFLLDLAFGLFLLMGIITIAILGWKIAKRSLAPVDMLSRYAQNLSPQNLAGRLPNTHLPKELSGLVLSFNGALERLEESYNRLSTFNSDVAHELRTPLGNLIGQTEVALSRHRSSEDFEEVLQSNLEELERLRTIINEMLFLSRADHGELATNLQEVSLAQVVRDTADFLDVVFEDNNMDLEICGDAIAKVEQSLFKRAMTNLLSNALQHGRPKTPIKVEITQNATQISIVVGNYGDDIAENDLRNIFNRFFRISKDRCNSFGNHGLGLAIVKAVAIMHGGDVFAQSQNGLIKVGFTLPRI